MAGARTKKAAGSRKKIVWSPVKFFVLGIFAFLASSISEKLNIEIANYTFAIIGLALFILAAKKQFRT